MNPNDPAFPSPAFDAVALPGCEAGPMRGMSLRAYFAGQALQMPFVTEILENELDWKTRKWQVAAFAVEVSDALIDELNKETNPPSPNSELCKLKQPAPA